MKKKRLSSDSSSDDDDDVPLRVIKNGYRDPNSYDSLCQHSIEACEFCDRISGNRFSSLVHNASHIIIPLLKQKVFQCRTCLHHFTSENDLSMHTLKKHPFLNTLPQIVIKMAPLEFNLNDIHPELIEKRTRENQDSKVNMTVIEKENESVEPKIESIKNRLVFEDDDVILIDCDDQLLNDLTTDCKVNVEKFGAPWLNGEDFSSKSVHYSDLVKPGVFRCKKCSRGFPTRYDAIIHESSHIIFKDSQITLCVICKKYILGDRNNLRLHYMKNHTSYQNSNNAPAKTILTEYVQPMFTEEKRVYDAKIIFLCELCLSFCKNSSSINYECIKSVCEIGKRFNCDMCHKQFFDINLVRRQVVRRHLNTNRKRKPKTKEERLKKISKRFKLLKQ